MKVLIPLLVVAVIAVAAQEHDEQRGLLSALNKRRAALAARISGIMRRSTRAKTEKDANGKTFNQDNNNNNRGYYQYQLDDNTHVYDTFTYYDEENPEKQATEENETNPGDQNDALRDDGEDYDENYEVLSQQQQESYQPENYYQSTYTQGEYISNGNDGGSGNRRPFSSLYNRLTSLFGRGRYNIDESKSAELTNLINEQIEIDNHIKYIQGTGQGRSSSANADDSYSPLHLSRSKIGENVQATSRQAGGAGVFIPITYSPSKGHNNNNNYYNNYNPYYQSSKPHGWVVKPVQHVYYPQNGHYKPSHKPSYPSYPIYFKPKDLEGPFGPPQATFGSPQATFGPPQATFGPPQATFGPPQATFGPPQATFGPPQATFGSPQTHEEWNDVTEHSDSDVTSHVTSLKEKLDSIENQIDFIKTHTDSTAGNRPHILFDLEVQGHELRNKIKRVEYASENNVSPYYKK